MLVKTRWVGVTELITHNNQTVDPLNPIAKKIKVINAKRKKTDADEEERSRLEWYGALYLDKKTKVPVIPGRCLAAAIRSGAKKLKLGKLVQEAVQVQQDVPIMYEGSKDPDEMWNDENLRNRAPAKVGQATVMRTRPAFPGWSLEFNIDLDESVLNFAELKEIIDITGRRIGLCDWRPIYGRFKVETLEQLA